MAHLMNKRGSHDNMVTYEHICDFTSDLANIDPQYITLGSVATVLKGDNGLQVYMAASDKTWVPLFSGGNNNSGGNIIPIEPEDPNNSQEPIGNNEGPIVNNAVVNTTILGQ